MKNYIKIFFLFSIIALTSCEKEAPGHINLTITLNSDAEGVFEIPFVRLYNEGKTGDEYNRMEQGGTVTSDLSWSPTYTRSITVEFNNLSSGTYNIEADFNGEYDFGTGNGLVNIDNTKYKSGVEVVSDQTTEVAITLP